MAARSNKTVDYRSTGASTQKVPAGIRSGVPFIGNLLRLARYRARNAVVKDAAASYPTAGSGPGHASSTARAPMDAGITRGSSLMFAGSDGRK